MKKAKSMLLICLAIVLLSSCGEEKPDSRDLVISGICENDLIMYGTLDLDLSMEGFYMDSNGGEGDIFGTAVYCGYNDASDTVYSVSGTWENDLTGTNDDIFRMSLESDDGMLALTSSTVYADASSIGADDLIYGSFTLDSETGTWHSSLSGYDDMDVVSATGIDSGGVFLDMVYIDGFLYGLAQTDLEYSIVKIDPGDGSSVDVDSSCGVPLGIAFDGTYIWITGKETSDSSGYSLFKYSGTSLDTGETGYPLSLDVFYPVGVLSCFGGTIYYHNESTNTSAIGSIDTGDGTMTPILYEEFGALPGLARTEKIAAVSDGFYTCYYAPGYAWCDIRKVDSEGTLVSRMSCPANLTGPLAVNGTSLYFVQSVYSDPDYSNRLYCISLE